MMKQDARIQDQFGRVHDYLRISLTERCNLRCFYCMPEEGIDLSPREQIMRGEEVIEIAKAFVSLGTNKIRLTGGEPLIRKDAPLILSGLAELPVELAVTTNGILIDRFIDQFRELGIRSLNVSLDSLDRERFNRITRRDYYDRVMKNILTLASDPSFKTKINMVVMKGVNDDEISNFVALTRDLPVHIRFIEFMPFDGNRWNWERGVSFEEIMDRLKADFGEEHIEKMIDQPNDTARNFKVSGFSGTFGIISSVTNPFCDSCNRMRLTANGKMKNCLFSQTETDLLGSFRKGDDIRPLILESVWHKKSARAGLSTFQEFADPEKHAGNRSMVMIGG